MTLRAPTPLEARILMTLAAMEDAGFRESNRITTPDTIFAALQVMRQKWPELEPFITLALDRGGEECADCIFTALVEAQAGYGGPHTDQAIVEAMYDGDPQLQEWTMVEIRTARREIDTW